jgi:hypothetical protein
MRESAMLFHFVACVVSSKLVSLSFVLCKLSGRLYFWIMRSNSDAGMGMREVLNISGLSKYSLQMGKPTTVSTLSGEANWQLSDLLSSRCCIKMD